MHLKAFKPVDFSAAARTQSRGMRPWRALGMVRSLQFEAPDYEFVSAPFSGDTDVLEGRLLETQLQPGLWLHCAEVLDLHSMVSRVPLEAGLRLVVVLAGELDVTLGGCRLQLSAGNGSHGAGALVAMPGAAMFERRWQRGKWERKLSLHFTPEWLKSHAEMCQRESLVLPPSFTRLASAGESADVRIFPWSPSPQAVSIAEQLMLDVAESVGCGLLRLRQAGRALELLYESLSQCHESSHTGNIASAMRPRDRERMLRLRDYLDAELLHPHDIPLTVEALGRRFGLSVSAMQRQFRQAFCISINEYRRSMRLLQAKTFLESGASVSEAASLSGYTSAANFATAFRRQFGTTPRNLSPRG